jgi:CDP-2,3-bis-(O-geranylgeranyl)-sn-glycerol synthase
VELESYSVLECIFVVLLIMAPAYLANTIAVLTGGRYPIDQGKLYSDGNRILGDGKTWSGLIGGTIGGMVVGYGLYFVIMRNFYHHLLWKLGLNSSSENLVDKMGSIIAKDPTFGDQLLWGMDNDIITATSIFFLLSFGALFGDMTASFYKRRQNLQRGDKYAILDMYDFIFMSLLLCFIFQRDWLLSWILDGWVPLFTILVLTPFLHRGVNIIGYKIGVKNEPW